MIGAGSARSLAAANTGEFSGGREGPVTRTNKKLKESGSYIGSSGGQATLRLPPI